MISKKTLGAAVFLAATRLAFGDIAILSQVGPKSEALAANPGVLDSATTETKINMEKAVVDIALSKGEGDALHAAFTARFTMQNLERPESGSAKIVVAFPATGFDAKLVTISNFQVTVNGKVPPTILRRTIEISRRENKIVDTTVSGKWAASFESNNPTRRASWWNEGHIKLRGAGSYDNSYLWSFESTPGSTNEIVVSYFADIQLQEPVYRKEYTNSGLRKTEIPFAAFPLEDDSEGYYLFDYVLLSGSTWFGPIGNETITVSFPKEHSASNRAIRLHRRIYPRDDDRIPESLHEIVTDQGPENQVIYHLAGRPEYDLLIAVKKSLIR